MKMLRKYEKAYETPSYCSIRHNLSKSCGFFQFRKTFFPTSSSSFVSLLSTNSMSILSDRWVGTFLFLSSNDPSFYHHYSWRCVWAYSMVKKSFNWNYSLNLKNGKISISTFTKEIFRAAELGCYGNCGCNWV